MANLPFLLLNGTCDFGEKAELHAHVEAIALKIIHGDDDVPLACNMY